MDLAAVMATLLPFAGPFPSAVTPPSEEDGALAELGGEEEAGGEEEPRDRGGWARPPGFSCCTESIHGCMVASGVRLLELL